MKQVFKVIPNFFIIFLILPALSFDYNDQAHWGDISATCSTGKSQSPINVPCQEYVTVCPSSKQYEIHWNNEEFDYLANHLEDLKTMFPNRTFVKFTNETSQYIYGSLQLHFHSPSEHKVNNKAYDL
jgi:carbonic anhydrase